MAGSQLIKVYGVLVLVTASFSDEDECDQGTNDCQSTQMCENLEGGFTCDCIDGTNTCDRQWDRQSSAFVRFMPKLGLYLSR